MDLDSLPAQLRPVLNALAAALRKREPAIRERVERLRREHPDLSPDELGRLLIKTTRRRVAATGAASGAAAIAPGLGTLVAIGTVTSQSVYALEQETELVLAIAMIYGHELAGSDQRLLEALMVVGIAGGAVKLREDVLVIGGERITVAAFRRLPERFLSHTGSHVLTRVLARLIGGRAAAGVLRVAPLAVGVVVGAGFDYLAVTALGRAAMRYYGPGGPAARHVEALPLPEDRGHVEGGH
ncbi:MAG TPA: hypothetical protein VF134_09055 [Candidatus Dormibacteraeota bacterium]